MMRLNSGMMNDGIFVTIAAGNQDADACEYSPSSASEPVTVAATNFDDSKATYSNWGPCVDIFAPGTAIRAAYHTDDNAFEVLGGTSMAAPMVAGVAALVYQAHPTATPAEVKQYILQAAFKDAVTAHDPTLYSDLPPNDDEANLLSTTRDLLRVDKEAWSPSKVLSPPSPPSPPLRPPPSPPPPPCSGASTDWSIDCPARGSVICGGATDEATGLARPVRSGVSTCTPLFEDGEQVCTCDSILPKSVVESCVVDANDYTYLSSCGQPTGFATTSLQGKMLTFTPRDDYQTYGVTMSSLTPDGDGKGTLPQPAYIDMGLNYGARLKTTGIKKIGFPQGLSFPAYSPETGAITRYTKAYVGGNGFVSLSDSDRCLRGNLQPSLENHFSASRGKELSISALFANLEVSRRAVDSGADVPRSPGWATAAPLRSFPHLSPPCVPFCCASLHRERRER